MNDKNLEEYRKKSKRQIEIENLSLADYVTKEILTENQYKVIKEEFLNKKNFLIIGKTYTGKSTLVEKFLKEILFKDCTVVKMFDDISSIKSLENIKATNKRIIIDELSSINFPVFSDLWGKEEHQGGIVVVNSNSIDNSIKFMELLKKESHSNLTLERILDRNIHYIIQLDRDELTNEIKVINMKKVSGFRSGYYLFRPII